MNPDLTGNGNYHTGTRATDIPLNSSENYLNFTTVGNSTTNLTVDQVMQGVLSANPVQPITLYLPSAAAFIKANSSLAVIGYGRHLYISNDGNAPITIALSDNSSALQPNPQKLIVGPGVFAAHFYIRFINVSWSYEKFQLMRL
jgi:hypothetical protein